MELIDYFTVLRFVSGGNLCWGPNTVLLPVCRVTVTAQETNHISTNLTQLDRVLSLSAILFLLDSDALCEMEVFNYLMLVVEKTDVFLAYNYIEASLCTFSTTSELLEE